MVARVNTVAFQGIDVVPVDVQVHLGGGLPDFNVVGLPDKTVGESRERVRAAIAALGLSLPPRRITVNLSPADLTKEGSQYDLPIAVGLLVAMGVLEADQVDEFVVLGEMALDGRLTPVAGVLPAAMGAMAQARGIICPAPCGGEAAWAGPERDFAVLAPPRSSPSSTTSRARRCSAARRPNSRRTRRPIPICATSRARRRPSAPSRSRPRAAITC